MYKSRESNIELLRIVSMLFIILGHFIGQGGGSDYPQLGVWASVLGSGSRIGANIFLIIGAWYLVDAGFRSEKIIKLYYANLFYTCTITLIMYAVGVSLSVNDLSKALFPFIRKTNWFVIIYICLLLLAPFLKNVFGWEQKKQRLLILVLTILIPCVCSVTAFMDSYLDNMLYFIYVYILAGYIKKNIFDGMKIGFIWICLGSGIYLLLALLKYYLPQDSVMMSYASRLVMQYLADFKSLPNLFIALCIFLWVLKHSMGSVKIINFLAANTMGVYCIHQTPCFYDYLWKDIFKCEKYWNTDYAVIYTLCVSLMVFILATAIDKLRVMSVEKVFLRSRFFCFLNEKLTKAYSDF